MTVGMYIGVVKDLNCLNYNIMLLFLLFDVTLNLSLVRAVTLSLFSDNC